MNEAGLPYREPGNGRSGDLVDTHVGRLVRLFPRIDYSSELAYYVIYRPECANLPRLAAFREWIIGEAGATLGSSRQQTSHSAWACAGR